MQLQLQINFRLRRIKKLFLLVTHSLLLYGSSSACPTPRKTDFNGKAQTTPDKRYINNSTTKFGRSKLDIKFTIKIMYTAIQLPKSTKLIVVSVCKTFYQSSHGSVTRSVSSRSGDVETSATGQSINSSILRTYLIALAGKSAHDRAPSVLSLQPGISS